MNRGRSTVQIGVQVDTDQRSRCYLLALQIPLFEVCLRLFRTAMASCASRVLFYGLPLIRECLLRLGAYNRLPDLRPAA